MSLDTSCCIEREQISDEEIVEYFKGKGIDLRKGFTCNADQDILAIFPGNVVIRRSEAIAKMNGHCFGICKSGPKCREYNSHSYFCAHNNYDRLDKSQFPVCYVPIELNGNGKKKT